MRDESTIDAEPEPAQRRVASQMERQHAMAIAGTGAAPTSGLTEEQQREAWSEWRYGKVCRDLLSDMAAGEVEFGDALHTAFIAGAKAALAK